MQAAGRLPRSAAVLASWLIAGIAAAAPALGPGVEWPILERMDVSQTASAVAVSTDGARAAVADAPADPRGASTIRLFGDASEPIAVELPGQVRSLVFSAGGERLYALQHRPRKKKRPGITRLVSLDFDRPRPREVMLVPEESHGISLHPDGSALLLACRNELRTVRLPGEQSGPLYRILGRHRAVVSLAGSRQVLLGGGAGLLLVDLGDRPGEKSMPVRRRLATAAPVVSLSVSAGGQRTRARLEDGTLIDVDLPQLQGSPAGRASVLVSWIPPDLPAPSAAGAPSPAAPDAPRGADAAPVPERSHPAPPAPAPPPSAEAPGPSPATPAAEPAAREPDQSRPAPEEVPRPVTGDEAAHEAEPEALPAPPDGAGKPKPPPPESRQARAEAARISGRIEGLDGATSPTVVLFGPDNLLLEARRVLPSPDGHWAAEGLPPGRYRVQLDAGGRTVLITDPPFLWVEIPESGSVRAEPIRVLRVL